MKSKTGIYTLVIILSAILAMAGCKKDSTGANVAFIGSYTGTEEEKGNSFYYTPDAVRVLASGVNPNQITIIDSAFFQEYTGNVNGNSIIIVSGTSFPGDSTCGTETFTGNGSLAGSELTYSINLTLSCNGFLQMDSFLFNGTRN